jgi:4-hydroxybenzoate polyprenyltransferase
MGIKNIISLWVLEFRVSHWTKNLFVFAPILFDESIFDSKKLFLVCLAFLSMCCVASGIYIINDIVDEQKDKNHPTKKNRPIASGSISFGTAIVVSVCLLSCGLIIAKLVNNLSLFIVIAYVSNNIIYCFLLRNKVIADVLSISIGFMLRFMLGAFAVHIDLSRWFLMCTFSLTLFLAFGKRRTEIQGLDSCTTKTRAVFASYSKENLNAALAFTGSLTTIIYMLFTTSPETSGLHNTKLLIWTVPVVVYAIFRYMFKVMEGEGDGPVDILLKDNTFIIVGVVWLFMVFTFLYLN